MMARAMEAPAIGDLSFPGITAPTITGVPVTIVGTHMIGGTGTSTGPAEMIDGTGMTGMIAMMIVGSGGSSGSARAAFVSWGAVTAPPAPALVTVALMWLA